MGFLASIKKKPKNHDGDDGSGIKQQQSSASSSATSRPPIPSSTSSKKKSKWSPLRKSAGKSQSASLSAAQRLQQEHTAARNGNSTNLISPSPSGSSSVVLQQLNVMAAGDIEVMTPETKQALMEQREAIRRKLFGGAAGTSVASSSSAGASAASSIEAMLTTSRSYGGGGSGRGRAGGSILRSSSTPDRHSAAGVRSIWRTPSTPTGHRRAAAGNAATTTSTLTADKASLPLSAVTLSADSNGSWEVMLQPEQPLPSALSSVAAADEHEPAPQAPAAAAANIARTTAPRQQETTTRYDIDDSRVSRASQPVSVDISYDTTTTGTSSERSGSDIGISYDTTTTTTTEGGGSTSLEELETSIEATPQRIFVTSQRARSAVDRPATSRWVAQQNASTSTADTAAAAALISPELSVSGALYRDKSSLKPPAGAPEGSYDEFDDFVAGHQRQLQQQQQQENATPTRSSSFPNKPLSPPFENGGDDSFLLPDTVTPVVTNKKVDPALFGGNASNNIAAPPLNDQQSQSLGSTTRTTNRGTSQGGGATITTGSISTNKNSMGTGSASFTTNTDTDTLTTGQHHRQLVGNVVNNVARDLVNAAMQCSPVRLGEQVDKHADLVCRPLQSKDSYATTSSSVSSAVAARQRKAAAPRPVYLDQETALRFIRRVTHNGFILLYLQPPKGEEDDWHGRTITMTINKGESESTEDGTVFRPPQLEWMTVAGGQVAESTTTTVNLMDILDISTNLEDMMMEDDDGNNNTNTNNKIPLADDDDLCVFTITTGDGDVHMFEAAHTEERDRIVNGLKTVIARLSFHLVVGDTTAVAELFRSDGAASHSFLDEQQPDKQDRSILRHPSRTVDQLAHTLLDETYTV